MLQGSSAHSLGVHESTQGSVQGSVPRLCSALRNSTEPMDVAMYVHCICIVANMKDVKKLSFILVL